MQILQVAFYILQYWSENPRLSEGDNDMHQLAATNYNTIKGRIVVRMWYQDWSQISTCFLANGKNCQVYIFDQLNRISFEDSWIANLYSFVIMYFARMPFWDSEYIIILWSKHNYILKILLAMGGNISLEFQDCKLVTWEQILSPEFKLRIITTDLVRFLLMWIIFSRKLKGARAAPTTKILVFVTQILWEQIHI